MSHAQINACQEIMKDKVHSLEEELSRVRTGRASVNMLTGIRINYYGTPTALNQVASLSTPDAKTIVIAPFEAKFITDIEKAIQIADIGVQPNSDGHIVRLPIPPLNEERRKEIAKSIKKMGESAKIRIRTIRQDVNTKIKKEEKEKLISEDESIKLQKEVQNLTDQYSKNIDERTSKKEKEVLSF